MVGTHFLVRYITDIAKIGSAVTFAPRPCLIPAELVGVRALLGQVYGFFDGAGLLWKEGTRASINAMASLAQGAMRM